MQQIGGFTHAAAHFKSAINRRDSVLTILLLDKLYVETLPVLYANSNHHANEQQI